MKSQNQWGITLIELLVPLVIVGILASIAIPSYREYVSRGHRADAKAVLMEDVQFMERNFTLSNKYNQDSAGTAISLPYTQSPKTGTALYTISATTLSATQFVLSATPVVGGAMAGDGCGALTYDQQGVKGVTGGLSVGECWNK